MDWHHYWYKQTMNEEDEPITGEVEGIEGDAPAVQFGSKRPRRMTLEYLFDLREMVEEMRKKSKIKVHRFDIHDPTPDVVVELMEAGLGSYVPELVLSFFKSVSDGLELKWDYEEDDELKPGGHINVLNFGRVFGSWLDELWGVSAEDASEKDVNFTWELRALEALEVGDRKVMTVLHVAEDEPTYELYFHDPYGASHQLDLDFVDYFECLLDTRGFYGWQYMVSDVDFDQVPHAAERAREFHRVMPGLFPDEVFTRYRNPDADA